LLVVLLPLMLLLWLPLLLLLPLPLLLAIMILMLRLGKPRMTADRDRPMEGCDRSNCGISYLDQNIFSSSYLERPPAIFLHFHFAP